LGGESGSKGGKKGNGWKNVKEHSSDRKNEESSWLQKKKVDISTNLTREIKKNSTNWK